MLVGPAKGTRDRPNAQATAPDLASAKTLEHVLRTLHQADHDYDGFRVRAIHNVHRAIHHLGGTAPAIGDPPG